MEYTQDELEEMVAGKSSRPSAVFFEHAVLDVAESKARNRRVYEKKVFVKLTQVGCKDSMSYEAQPVDIAKYKREYEYFMDNRQGVKEPSVDIIPSLDIIHLQELRDYGILTIPQLAAAKHVPPHLEYAYRAAKIFNQAIKETSNASIEEETIEENHAEESCETSFLSAPDRQEHRNGDRQPSISGGIRRAQTAGSSEGNEASRFPHGRKFVISDWSITIP